MTAIVTTGSFISVYLQFELSRKKLALEVELLEMEVKRKRREEIYSIQISDNSMKKFFRQITNTKDNSNQYLRKTRTRS